MEEPDRAELVVVAGGTTPPAARGVEQVVARIRAEDHGTVSVHHDLREVGEGVVVRTVHHGDEVARSAFELAHGCVSCTLREDVLPLLREFARRPGVRRIVLHLDPVLEPEQVCWSVLNVVVDGAPITDAVDLRGVITVLDAGSWLDDATGPVDVADSGLAALPDDDRTVAQLVVAQAEFADLLVYAGTAEEWQLARSDAVLSRLTPMARRLTLSGLDRSLLLDQLPRDARRGRPDHAHGPLLRGEPPIRADGDVQLTSFSARRPFHPARLHEAIDVLLTGVIRTRGRIWLATRPDAALWVETAGGGMQVAYAGDWLAAIDEEGWAGLDPERQVLASLRWHDRWGDRAQELVILVDGADPAVIDAALCGALLTDQELALGEEAWRQLPDPFGWWHTDPCGGITPEPARGPGAPGRDEQDQGS